jgi:predicted CoA-binding protein
MVRMTQTIAVIGASSNRNKFGNKALRAFVKRGYTVIPINLREHEVEGLQAYPSVLDVPGRIDLATLYVPPSAGIRVMDEIAKKGIGEVWLNPGADTAEVLTRARQLGLRTTRLCSILAIGESPASY